VILHDDLERDNDPRFFHDFMAHAGAHGLQYLGDAHFGQMFGLGIEQAALDKICGAGDVVAAEQYLDLLYGRSLRTTLLCRAEAPVVREMTPDAVRHLRAATAALVQSPDAERLAGDPAALHDGQPLIFRAPDCTLSVTRPVAKAALWELVDAAPRPLPLPELVERVGRRLSLSPQSGEAEDRTIFQQLAPMIVEWFAMRLVDLHAFDPPLAARAGERPVASQVVRYQLAYGWGGSENRATAGGEASAAAGPEPTTGGEEIATLSSAEKPPAQVHHVTNLLHRRVRLAGELAAQVLARLDGQHDRAAIVAELMQPLASGQAQIRIGNHIVTDPKQVEHLLTEQVETCLADFARHALLLDNDQFKQQAGSVCRQPASITARGTCRQP
jgi:methyltransferase-like protein